MARKRTLVQRGFLRVAIRERGPVRRGRKRAFNNASKAAWFVAAEYFHDHFRDNRFSEAHAQAAGYAARKGELQSRGSKAFRRSYTGQKLARHRHTNPLQFTGETREKIKTQFRITSTNKSGRIAYAGASKFSFRHPRSRVRMNEEFRRLLPSEVERLADVYDASLDAELAKQDGG